MGKRPYILGCDTRKRRVEDARSQLKILSSVGYTTSPVKEEKRGNSWRRKPTRKTAPDKPTVSLARPTVRTGHPRGTKIAATTN